MLLNFVYLLLWILVAVGLGAVLTVFVQLRIGCSAVSVNDPGFTSMNTCLPDGGMNIYHMTCHMTSL